MSFPASEKERVHLRVYRTVETVAKMARNYSDLPVTSGERRELDTLRPKTYGDCIERELGTKDNPCPFAMCQHNLFIDVTETGSIVHNWPGKDFDEIPATCALRVAEDGGEELGDVGELLNLTKQRIQQMEWKCLEHLKRGLVEAGVAVGQVTGDVEDKWRARRAR